LLRIETKLGHTNTDRIILKRVLHKHGCGLDLYETGQRKREREREGDISVCCNPKL
jgi:hypothetical protein